MTRSWFAVPATVFALGISITPGIDAQLAPSRVESVALVQEGWEIPPQELNEVQRRGFHDGVEGARRDFGNGRRPDVNNREEYRDPDDMPRDVPREMREVWREGFRRGYNVAASHLWAAPPQPTYPQPAYPPPAPNGDDWGMRGLRSDAERQGYREGIEEAHKDFQWHRRADPDDHEEYRNPYVAPQFVDEYREGFMRGYTVAMSQLNGDAAWRSDQDFDRWTPPDRFSDVERRGFRDGIEGARKDYGNHRTPDPANRDEYRSPNVPSQLIQEYREGFRRGYEMAAARLWGGM